MAAFHISVLIEGESGVGKSLLAEALHLWGYAPDRPFVRVDGARVPDGLAEATLFGHTRGSFTGAIGSRDGLIRKSAGGTLFIDEIHAMSLRTQGFLLTLAEEGTISPIGADDEVPVDVRLIFATNRNLRDLVDRGDFLPDLYARIRAVVLRVPPLRERLSEMRSIVTTLLLGIEKKEFRGRARWPLRVTDDAIEALKDHRWEQNIRELRNVLVQGLMLAQGASLKPEHLEQVFAGLSQDNFTVAGSNGSQRRLTRLPSSGTDAPRGRECIEDALRATTGNVSRAASQLGMSRSWLYELLRVHALDPAKFRRMV